VTADPTERLALELIDASRTMVLATADPAPWSAPVYFLRRGGRLYFFSSPKSRHAVAADGGAACAASIFRDSDDWRDIEGLQMEGVVEPVAPGVEAADVFARYVARFPTVRGFFDGPFDLGRFLETFRSRLYAFVPARVFYLNNRAGLGKRQEIRLDA
jgi:uncharacterized protein YhbP (UPF0306 family)